MDQPIDKVLLKKFIAGQCTAEEELAINHLLQLPEYKALFNLVLQEQWEEAAKFEVDEKSLQQWKNELDDKLGIREENIDKVKQLPLKKHLFRNAAVWVGLITCFATYVVLQLKTKPNKEKEVAIAMEEKINPYGKRSSFLLSDSTKVYLGAGSKLSFAKHFSNHQRTVHLEGEAYFEVTKNPKKPFVIYTDTVRTTVLGTSFKINAFRNKPLTVAVTTGKVRVDRLAGNRLFQSLAILTPGLKLSYNQGLVLTTKVSIDDTEKWKNGLLVFKATPLHQLATDIERWYNISIRIERKSLRNIPISVSIEANVPINKVLDGLAVAAKLKYKFKNKNEVIIY